jgi:hypothetical protein
MEAATMVKQLGPQRWSFVVCVCGGNDTVITGGIATSQRKARQEANSRTIRAEASYRVLTGEGFPQVGAEGEVTP